MTSTVFDFIGSLQGPPSVSGLGGERLIYAASQKLARDTRVVEVAVALCNEWRHLEDQAAAAALLTSAACEIPALAARDLYDVLLSAEEVLPCIALELEGVFKDRSQAQGYARDIVLESWTRLALGHWTKGSLQLRGLLQQSSESADASEPLVRALGAACSVWDDVELDDALRALSEHEELQFDAAMELGHRDVASAVSGTDLNAVGDGLESAVGWFDMAYRDCARPDAAAFRAVLRGVRDQVAGIALSDESLAAIVDAVYEYLVGFRGVHRGWRGARAGTTGAWLDLLTQLRTAEVDQWFSTDTTLRALAHAFAAEQTMVLVVNPGVKESASQVGVRELVWPRIEELARGNAAVVAHVERWLALGAESADSGTRNAVEALLARLRDVTPKKGDNESTRLSDAIRERLHLANSEIAELERLVAGVPALAETLQRIALQVPTLNLAEVDLLSSLLKHCDEKAEGGIGAFRVELEVLLVDIIRYASKHLNVGQYTSRTPSWIAHGQPWPDEDKLADDLNNALVMAGRDSQVELSNVAGGRVDLAVRFDSRCTLYIEVKTVDQDRSDAQLVDDFGTQAVQYAVTNIPVAILAVADYVPRRTRRDLTSVFHVARVQVDPTSRHHALVVVRLQANVAAPSATSAKRITRKRPARS